MIYGVTGVSSLRGTVHTLSSYCNFNEKSPKIHGIFERIQTDSQSFSNATTTLKSFCDARWYCRVAAVRQRIIIE